jgi:hypothetical protein
VLTSLLPLIGVVGTVLGLPLLGAVFAREPLAQFLQLPLSARGWDPLPLDTLVFWAATIAAAGLVLLVLRLMRPRAIPAAVPFPASPGRFPRWGWLGLLLAIGTASAGSAALGLPLFVLGLTLLWNADTERRTRSSLLTRRPLYFAALFPMSATFGWLYYYLNLYLQLWVYPSAGSALAFALAKTVGYSVLLPGLLSLRQWLASFPRILDWCGRARPLAVRAGPETGWILVGLACLGLAGAGVWPDWIYPLTWVAPLLLALGVSQLRDPPTSFAGIAKGDWSRIVLPALSALTLGGLVQLWNQVNGPFWVFSLPLIDAARVLGLAAPAYAGLLPLGLLGIWLADQLAFPWRRHPLGRFRKFPIKLVIKR